MAGWDGEANWNGDVLKRIVVLLFALANLADRAAAAPFLRRRQVLGILNRGEVEARAFVIGVAAGAAIPVDALESTGAAARLAVRLRALALILCVILAQAPPAPRIAIDHRAGQDGPAGRADRDAVPPAFDTS
jgi:hypothetical protein